MSSVPVFEAAIQIKSMYMILYNCDRIPEKKENMEINEFFKSPSKRLFMNEFNA